MFGCNDNSNETSKSGTKSYSHILTENKDNLSCDCKQNYREMEEYENSDKAKVLQETDKLHNTLYNILENLEKLLRQRMRSLLLRKQDLKNEIMNSVKDVQLNVNKTLENFFTDASVFEDPKVQEIQNLIESIDLQESEEETVDLDVIAKETLNIFFEFQDVYETHKSYLEALMNDIVKRQKFQNMSQNISEQEKSFLSKSVSRAKSLLDSSVEAFEESKTLIQNFMETPTQDIDITIDCLFLAIRLAESSCLELQSFTCTIVIMIV